MTSCFLAVVPLLLLAELSLLLAFPFAYYHRWRWCEVGVTVGLAVGVKAVGLAVSRAPKTGEPTSS